MRQPAWYADQQAAKRDVLRGRRGELGVALDLLIHGALVRIDEVYCVDGPADYGREYDVEANGVRVEVKSRDLKFKSAADYPHPTVFVGSEVKWRERRARGNLPAAVVVVSQADPDARLVIPTSTFSEWTVDPNGRDSITGRATPSYAAPLACACDFDALLELVANPQTESEATMSANGSPPALPVIVRKNHGRGHSYTLNGDKTPGATTVLGKGYPKHLEKWAAEQSGNYAVDHWDELADMPVSQRLKLIIDARFADRDAAARRGTEVHRFARRIVVGETVEVPDELAGHVDAYLRFLDEWQPAELLVEAPVASVRWRYCGTLDLLGDLVDGTRWLLDLKTTRSGVYRESALQLSAYRNAEYYLDLASGEVRPMIEVERCGVVWLRADRSYELVPVDASPATFRVFLAAHLIARFDEREDVLGAPLEAPVPELTEAELEEHERELAELEYGPPLGGGWTSEVE